MPDLGEEFINEGKSTAQSFGMQAWYQLRSLGGRAPKAPQAQNGEIPMDGFATEAQRDLLLYDLRDYGVHCHKDFGLNGEPIISVDASDFAQASRVFEHYIQDPANNSPYREPVADPTLEQNQRQNQSQQQGPPAQDLGGQAAPVPMGTFRDPVSTGHDPEFEQERTRLWKDDIESRVREAKDAATPGDVESFVRECQSRGIDVIPAKDGEMMFVDIEQGNHRIRGDNLKRPVTMNDYDVSQKPGSPPLAEQIKEAKAAQRDLQGAQELERNIPHLEQIAGR